MIRLKPPDLNFPSHCNACRRELSEMNLSLEPRGENGVTHVVGFCTGCAEQISALFTERIRQIRGKKF
jgi:hypothetical protein